MLYAEPCSFRGVPWLGGLPIVVGLVAVVVGIATSVCVDFVRSIFLESGVAALRRRLGFRTCLLRAATVGVLLKCCRTEWGR